MGVIALGGWSIGRVGAWGDSIGRVEHWEGGSMGMVALGGGAWGW